MQVASRQVRSLEDLHDAVGKRIAELLDCPAALVTSGCASALSLATAACVAGADRERIRRLPDTNGMKNEVLVQQTHRVGYDHAIRNAGVRLIEVETREELEKAINEQTAMMFFLNSSDPRGSVHHEEFVAIGKKHNVPTLIDAAADVPPVENLWRFTKLGFDLVGFSGGKGLRGPQSSGLLLGRKDLIAAARLKQQPQRGHPLPHQQGEQGGDHRHAGGPRVVPQAGPRRGLEGVGRRCQPDYPGPGAFKDVRPRSSCPPIANAVPHLRVSWDYKTRSLTRVADGQAAPRGRAEHRGVPGSRRAGHRRLDDGARRRRDRRPASTSDSGGHLNSGRSRALYRLN